MEGNKSITRKTGLGSSNRFHLPMSGHSPSSPLSRSPVPALKSPSFSTFPRRQSSSRVADSTIPRHLLQQHTDSPGVNTEHLDTALPQYHHPPGETDFVPATPTESFASGPDPEAAQTSTATSSKKPDGSVQEENRAPTSDKQESIDGQSSRASSSTARSGSFSKARSLRFSSPFTSKRSVDLSGGKSTKRKSPKRPPQVPNFTLEPTELKYVTSGHDPDRQKRKNSGARPMNSSSSIPRSESLSSTSVNTAQSGISGRTVPSTNPSASGNTVHVPRRKAFAQRNGRTYLNDPSLAYPLPIDLEELHRQTLRTLLLIQAHGGPVRSPALLKKPPKRVLEVGCSTGFWSMMCHRFYKSRGHSGISFTGVDIAPVAPGSANISAESIRPDKDMDWTFVQHDLRDLPWPFEDGEFDLVFSKDMATAIPLQEHPFFSSEILRVLKSGGVFEIWETDYTIRMLRPHVPSTGLNGVDAENQEAASSIGSYVVHLNTPLSAPLNTFLVEYNNWVSKTFESRGLWPTPGTMMSAYILAEIDILVGLGVHRVAIPFSEVRWEREGVGGVVTKDGKSYVEMRGDRPPHQKVEKKALTSAQAALRRTALLTFVEEIQALEPYLREVSGKSQDEWDIWMGKMTTDLMNEGGTSWGECLESGAWWATKR